MKQMKEMFAKARHVLAYNKDDVKGNRQAFTFMAFFFCAVSLVAPDMAFAGSTPWDGAADWVLGVLTGGLTRTIAIICVIACGIMAWAGKLSMEWAVKIVVGIVFVFGAATIVDAISGAVA